MAYTTIDKPSDYFNTKLYTGNGGTQSITGVGFQPDWVWYKNRSASANHGLFDAVRGATKLIQSNNTGAEQTVSGVTSFNSDGFGIGADSDGNGNGNNIVAWNWKKSATAGFDIVSFTTSGDDENFSHSLGVKPELIIFKARASSGNWAVLGEFAETTFNNKYMVLNLTDAQGSDGSYSNPTASQFSTSNNVAVDSTHIAYLFRSVQGFSKIGSYTGNGNADGTFVYTGFKPAFTIIKRTDTANDWMVGDNKINPFNVTDNMLRANLNNVQQSGNYVDYLSNGFKLRLSGNAFNGSGGTYIYMAFAESPFVTSTGIPTTAR